MLGTMKIIKRSICAGRRFRRRAYRRTHFTPPLFSALDRKGIIREAVTLHVGLGTFLPVTASGYGVSICMHAEFAVLSTETAAQLEQGA